MTKRLYMMLALLLPLAGCDSDAPAPVAEEKGPPAIFPAGEYEISALTETLRSADKTTPATKHKVGTSEVQKICSPAGPKPASALFADKGDSCTSTSDYAKNGRINMSYRCQRPGRGLLTLTLDGKFDENSFEVEVATGTYFSGQGDYVLTQRLKGKRPGDCAAPAQAAG